MKIEIAKIQVASRIRRLYGKIEDLAADIEKNGLINPITVMPAGGKYQLLAGLRRLKAAQSLGWTEIEATCVGPKDAEAALHIEYSENVQREEFTFSDKMDYARLVKEIEQVKAKGRMSQGGKSGVNQGVLPGSHLDTYKSRDKIGPKIGMSGPTYQRAEYVADHAPQDVIDALDRGETTIRATYDAMRAAEKQAEDVSTSPPAATPESDLDRAIRAEQERNAMKYRWHNEIFHRDETIAYLKRRVAALEQDLETAYARIHELEERAEPTVDGKGRES